MAGLRVKLELKGVSDMLHRLDREASRWEAAVAQGVYLEGNNVMAVSQRRVPVDLGILKASGYVTPPEVTPSRIQVELGYGGPAKDYAIVQHERTDFNHPQGGQAKFLQSAVDERAANFTKNVAALAEQAYQGGSVLIPGPYPATPEGGQIAPMAGRRRRRGRRR